jgi:hypothetical protein
VTSLKNKRKQKFFYSSQKVKGNLKMPSRRQSSSKKGTIKKAINKKTKHNPQKVRGVKALPSLCSPKSLEEDFQKTGSCFSKDALVKIATAYNREHSDQEPISTNQSPKKIWDEIALRLKDNCKDETCWVEQDFLKKQASNNNLTELEESLKPKKPESWKKNRMGQCIVNELCNINVKRLLEQGLNRIGVVFNLDPHDKPGSHWVAMFANLRDRSGHPDNRDKKRIHKSQKPSIHYFDSYGMEPPKEILILMRRIRYQAYKLGIKMRIFQSAYRHQYQNSECGIYSIYFITQMLQGKDLYQFNKYHHSDSKMTRKRNDFFRE